MRKPKFRLGTLMILIAAISPALCIPAILDRYKQRERFRQHHAQETRRYRKDALYWEFLLIDSLEEGQIAEGPAAELERKVVGLGDLARHHNRLSDWSVDFGSEWFTFL